MDDKIHQRALIVKSTGSWYQARIANGKVIDCRIRGKFRINGLSATNPLAVGDWVDIAMEQGQDTGIIIKLHDRKNYIVRRSVNLSKQVQIIASNIDHAILVVTLASPPTSLGFIDRFLVTTEAYHIPATLVFNKLDLFSQDGLEILSEYKLIYEAINYRCMEVSAKTGKNIDLLQKMLGRKTTLIMGHSGTGKSTLINQLIPGVNLRTGHISSWSDKGKHTTTFAEMFDLPGGGYLIDTPGIQEFGIVHIKPEELAHFFPEFQSRLAFCKFHNCRHINEPGCAVLKALDNGDVSPSRYQSYLSIYQGNETRV